ncbi:MAG TPA: hypothetical protein DDX39_11355 [Bacteroidales bacterium]|nr:MAG: hypothetical protein A2W98_13950 [Bacteroidetes bacterium GWF2_33_38]OFY74265.1 MAG: hypothetical protein A2265_01035 [Bacteroidetes bacterium RIFOXYA12_FULL_33_9]OFY86223.1 MAG: hypothetical protein A2236_13925 [Bacteroidetes bacterium RIFOXYA2_FULL_33_7]HBF89228.1 hypothetical protein [Bacteroidales bacterium]
MKRLLLIAGFMLSSIIAIQACEFEIEVVGEKKATYKIGDEIVIKVKAIFIHRNCDVVISDTKFNPTGLKIKSATEWKEIQPGVWERKVKLTVVGTKDGNLIFNAVRTCPRTGGSGSIKFISEPLKS